MVPGYFNKIDVVSFLDLALTIPVVDVRSPSEYRAGHIPGSVNIPLFDDDERREVGTTYNKQGRTAAIIAGFKLTGPGMHSRLEEGLKVASGGKLLVHCWRGGMRSEAMAWLFSQGGIDCDVLTGGYKAYRHHLLSELSVNRKMIILGGLTGTGKTSILKILEKHGCQVIDLENLANHKGSAFGSLGQLSQPSSEHFANLLYEKWRRLDPLLPVWLEDESFNIGSVFMPEEFFGNMKKSPAIILLMDINTRIGRLVKEYSHFPPEELEASVMKIKRRLGGDRAKDATKAIVRGDIAKAVEIVLNYYDKTYLFGVNQRKGNYLLQITTHSDDPEINAMKLLEASKSVNWQDRTL
jgi:tRNA 2-selenouridine synthase